MNLDGDWETKMQKSQETLAPEADIIIMKRSGCGESVGDADGWCKSTGTPPIGAWAVTPASAVRVLRALKRPKMDCHDFDCVMGEMGRIDGLNVYQAPGNKALS